MGILEGKIAIVTGASSGIGKACALRFAEEGATVVACARRLKKLQELVSEISGKGGRAIAIACDVGKEEDIDNVVNTTIGEFSKVDILANIAQGGMDQQTYLHEVTTENALEAYITGPLQSLLFMQKCLPIMKEQHYGRIINTASHSALRGSPGFSAYEMAKGAVLALTRNASQEWGIYGITTNVFLPIIRTESFDLSPQGIAAAEKIEKQILSGILESPTRIAHLS